MGKFWMEGMPDIPEEIKAEIVILYNLGVGVEDLRYLLNMRMAEPGSR